MDDDISTQVRDDGSRAGSRAPRKTSLSELIMFTLV